jgi:excisionase family DNA binding protein
MPAAEMLPIKEAAFRLGVSTRMMWKMVAEGQIETAVAGRTGRKSVIADEALRQFADALEAATLLDHPELKTYGSLGPDRSGRYFVRAVEAARMMECTRQRVEQLVREGEIAAFRIGRCVLLRPKDVEGYLRWRNGDKDIRPPEETTPPARPPEEGSA